MAMLFLFIQPNHSRPRIPMSFSGDLSSQDKSIVLEEIEDELNRDASHQLFFTTSTYIYHIRTVWAMRHA